MGGVVAFGECMVEVSVAGSGSAVIGYAGDVFNTGVYLRRLGTPVSFATALVDGDPFSVAIVDLMAAEGIGAELVTRLPGRLPGLYAIHPDEQGERSFFFWRERSPFRQFFEIADLGAFKAALTNADLVYLTAIPLAVVGDEGRTALGEILAELAGRGVKIAFDTNYRPSLWPSREAALAAVEAVIPYCTLVSASGPDAEALTLRSLDVTAAEWAERGPQVIARADDRTVAVHAGASVLRLPAPPAVRESTLPAPATASTQATCRAGCRARRPNTAWRWVTPWPRASCSTGGRSSRRLRCPNFGRQAAFLELRPRRNGARARPRSM